MRHVTVVSLLLLLLSWAMVPGVGELAENVAHLAIHGDLAHGQPLRQGHAPFNPEHGCGGGFHLCSCCHAQQSLTVESVSVASAQLPAAPWPPAGADNSAYGFASTPDQPPRG